MKRVFVVLAAVAAVATSAAPTASPVAMKAPDPCALGSHRPLWIDFADGSVPFWEVFARPGVIAAASNFIFPAQLRARGAKTIYWDMHLDRRVGTPTEPLDPGLVVERANRLYTYAAASTGCARPMIAENELFSAAAVAPWSRTNTQYRNDVLLFLQTLARHGAHPVLLVSVRPYTGGVAYDWWRAVAEVSDIVREVYFPGPRVYERGPSLGTRFMRIAFRSSMTDFLELGIPPSRLGLMLGFQTTPGQGGRERLNRAAWLRLVKLQAFAAKTVARDLHLNTIWSWGWGVWSKGEDDPDKPAAACVWLWAREPKLCDAPKVAGPAFNASRREGQLSLPHNVRCTVFGTRRVRWDVDAALGRLVGDSEAGFTAAYARTVASSYVHVRPKRVAAAERAVIELRFGGSRAAYNRALRSARISAATARGIIGDELRRASLEPRLKVAAPAKADLESYYETYGNMPVRLVATNRPVPWLGGHKRGLAPSSIAPAQVFKLRTGRTAKIRTMLGVYKVKAIAAPIALGALPMARARGPIRTALLELRRQQAYDRWLLSRERYALDRTVCWRDQLPAADVVVLTDEVPFLALEDSGS